MDQPWDYHCPSQNHLYSPWYFGIPTNPSCASLGSSLSICALGLHSFYFLFCLFVYFFPQNDELWSKGSVGVSFFKGAFSIASTPKGDVGKRPPFSTHVLAAWEACPLWLGTCPQVTLGKLHGKEFIHKFWITTIWIGLQDLFSFLFFYFYFTGVLSFAKFQKKLMVHNFSKIIMQYGKIFMKWCILTKWLSDSGWHSCF